MKHRPSEDDLEFQRRFEAREVAPSEFHHREHLRLAYVYVCLHGPGEAHRRLREALFQFIDHNRGDRGRYHETLTRAWVLAVHHFMSKTSESSGFDDFLAAHPILLDKTILSTHYSSDALSSEEARQSFVEPDLTPIPRHTD